MHCGSIRLPLSLGHCCWALFSCALRLLGWQDNYILGQIGRRTGNAPKSRSRLPRRCWCRRQDQAPDLISTLPAPPAWLWNADDWKPEGKADTAQPRSRHSRYLVPATITYSFWNLGCPSNTRESGGKLLHNIGALHLLIINMGTSRIKPHRMKDLTGRKIRLASEAGLISANQPTPSSGRSTLSMKASHHQQRAVFLWQINSTM